MLRKPRPKLRARAGLECVGPDADDARTGAGVRSRLADLAEEVHAALRPLEPSGAIGERALPADALLQPVEDLVETDQVRGPVIFHSKALSSSSVDRDQRFVVRSD